jgi:hypothetical protein
MTDDAEPLDHGAWPLRPVLLLAIGGGLGLLVYFLLRGAESSVWTQSAWRIGLASAVAVGGIVFAFSLERLRWAWTAGFALFAGLVAGFVTYWNGSPDGWGSDEGWQFFACLLAVAIAVPLFQSMRDSGAARLSYRAVHTHAWTNLVLWGAAWAFVGASVLLVVLLSELFHLIHIDALRDLFEKEWFGFVLVGATLGGAVGLLRDRDKVLGLLQRVVTAILSVLAPVLALGLVVFVLALPFTGLAPLWESTKSTTPILLVCDLAAFGLINAVLGTSPEEETNSRVLRWSAAALAAVMLPLAIVAAVSLGKRIDQYGLTPDRLWAGVFVVIAAATGAAYLYALARGRAQWPRLLRPANLRLASGICLLALFLALPIVSFGSLSARDQISRLESGRTLPSRFDWGAMRFDFGSAGRRALGRLAASSKPGLRLMAAKTLKAESRWAIEETVAPAPRAAPKLALEGGVAVPPRLADASARNGSGSQQTCRLVFASPARAVVLSRACETCGPDVTVFSQAPGGEWAPPAPPPPIVTARMDDKMPLDRRRVEVRTVQRQQVFVDGKPVGQDFD